MKKVNILLSTYNGEKYLEQQLRSLEAQTYPEVTIYIRDDGSTDSTLLIIEQYVSKFSNIILIEKGSNIGYCQSYARLCQMVPSADFYAFCDQDDVWSENKIARAVEIMQQEDEAIPLLFSHRYNICDVRLNILNENVIYHKNLLTKESKNEFAKTIMMGDWYGQGFTLIFNHSLRTIAFPDDAIITISHDVWMSWVFSGFCGEFLFDEEPLVQYRRHDHSTSVGSHGIVQIYKNRIQNCNELCLTIHEGLQEYRDCFYEKISVEKREILDMLMSKKRFRKFFYKRRYRDTLIDEIAFRILMLFNQL